MRRRKKKKGDGKPVAQRGVKTERWGDANGQTGRREREEDEKAKRDRRQMKKD